MYIPLKGDVMKASISTKRMRITGIQDNWPMDNIICMSIKLNLR